MEFKDIFITPFILLLLVIIAFLLRKKVSTPNTQKYFLPALCLKFTGALAIGFIYQFYYSGGDTFNYFDESVIINSALGESVGTWIKIMLSDGTQDSEIFDYTSRLYWFKASSEFIISKICGIFGIITLNTYSATALLFAFFSFTGLWAMYQSFVSLYPNHSGKIAIAFFFVPSLFFWGSGIMKDTVTIGCLGWLFYGFYNLTISKRRILSSTIIILICIFFLKEIRVFMLLAFLPPAAYWIFMENNKRIKTKWLRYVTVPFFLITGIGLAYYLLLNVSAGDVRYDINNIGTYMKINAEYLYQHSLNQGGSAYYLGKLDGTIWGSIKLAPQAIWVTLFRPNLWEVNNIVMLLSALESTVILIFTVYVLFSVGPTKTLNIILKNPLVLFSITFSLIFAFAVGITSYNFGTLVRYKIPIFPFYLSAFFIILDFKKKHARS